MTWPTLTPRRCSQIIQAQRQSLMGQGDYIKYMNQVEYDTVKRIWDEMPGSYSFSWTIEAMSKAIEIVVHNHNPLDTQLKRLTDGDGWTTQDWSNTLGTGYIVHKKTNKIVFVHNDETLKGLN